jgi:hypothetical protein
MVLQRGQLTLLPLWIRATFAGVFTYKNVLGVGISNSWHLEPNNTIHSTSLLTRTMTKEQLGNKEPYGPILAFTEPETQEASSRSALPLAVAPVSDRTTSADLLQQEYEKLPQAGKLLAIRIWQELKERTEKTTAAKVLPLVIRLTLVRIQKAISEFNSLIHEAADRLFLFSAEFRQRHSDTELAAQSEPTDFGNALAEAVAALERANRILSAEHIFMYFK